MRSLIQYFFILLAMSLVGCQRDVPEPETKSLVVSAAQLPQTNKFQVKYYIKNNNVLIECMIPNISFRNQKSESQQSKMLVYVDGKKYMEMTSAAFIIRNLKPGNHRVSLQVVKNNGQKTSFKKDMLITIP